MKILVIHLLAVTMAVSLAGNTDFAWAQDFLADASDTAVFIRWKRSNPSQPFNIYRKSATGGEVRLSKKPILPQRHRSEVVQILDKDTPQYLEMFKVRYPEQIHEALDKNPAANALAGAIDPRIAILRGEGFIDSTVVKGTIYTYRVTEISPPSGTQEILYGEVKDIKAETVPPQPPKHLAAADASRAIHLFLEPADGPNAGYDVYRADSKNGEYRKINMKRIFLAQSGRPGPQLPGYIDRKVEIGRDYWYKAVTLSVLGSQSEFRGPVSAKAYDRTPPVSPVIKKISEDSKGYLHVEWEQGDLKDVSGFHVYRSETITSNGEILTRSQKLAAHIRSYQDQTAQKGKLYWYRVTAVSHRGNEGFSVPKKGVRKNP